jgi:hypothetical protein
MGQEAEAKLTRGAGEGTRSNVNSLLTWSGDTRRGSEFGCLTVKPESFGFRPFAAWLGPAENAICVRDEDRLVSAKDTDCA